MAVILLDISRTISRASHPLPTGIDRVEHAYIEHFLTGEKQVYFLSRVLKGYVLLDKPAMKKIWPIIIGKQPWQKRDLISLIFSHKLPKLVNQAESTLRRAALAMCFRAGLADMLSKHLAPNYTYLNVGHANRKPQLWQALKASRVGKTLAMVHDVIPLDFPEYTRPDTASRFESELKATAQACDALIYNSEDTARRTEVWLKKWQLSVPSLPILLGTEPLPAPPLAPLADPAEFVILSTIEPRKNHKLLLDIWPEIDAQLHIIGQRGWQNEAVFRFLDASPMMGQNIFEHTEMSDEALAKKLSSARALLFPSFAEGFGFPLIEALQMRLPVICADLPCFREIAGDLPTYLPPDDRAGWVAAIKRAASCPREEIPENVSFPTWNQHFAKLNRFLYDGCKQSEQKTGK